MSIAYVPCLCPKNVPSKIESVSNILLYCFACAALKKFFALKISEIMTEDKYWASPLT